MQTLRYLTAGESHGPALVGILEGLPAGVAVDRAAVEHQLERRRSGHGRSPRMAFEADRLEILAGVRHGLTMGSPVALVVHNSEWAKWEQVMAVDLPIDPAAAQAASATGRGAPLTRPRPGHADLAGMQKYGLDEVRNVLERASARETAMRVALAAVARGLLQQVGVVIASHVVQIGEVTVGPDAPRPTPQDPEAVDASEVRCCDDEAGARMVARIDRAKAERDTLGGVIEVLVFGLPPGLGSHVHWDRKLDGRLSAALASIPAMKGVEVGDGFATAGVPGSQAHDEIVAGGGERPDALGLPERPDALGLLERPPDALGLLERPRYRRLTGRAGGLEGGMTTGEPLRLRVAMKPLSSLTQPLRTVDVRTGEPAQAIQQRSDVCAVPRAGVVAEAVVGLVLADALLEKTGGDSLAEVQRNLAAYRATL